MGKKTIKKSTSFLGTSALTRPLFALSAASVMLGSGSAYALDPNTLPQNPNVVGGKDSFSQSGNTLNVNQSTNRTVIDWRSFDIGSKAQVNFAQPGTSSIAVNRINGSTNPTDIEGGLHANGQVWILNPNGVFFGKGARVDAAGIVASTANINDKAFMAGSNTLQMTGADHGSVENQGRITVGANGLAAFVAPSVRNSGTINATVGRVTLAAGTTYTLDLAGDHLVELGLGSVKAVVDNSGKIVNPGGTIALTAKAAGQVVNSVVNVSGVVSASSATKSGGTVILGADTINTTKTSSITADAGTNGTGGTITSVANVQGNYAGSFSAKGGSESGDGGKIETSGHGAVDVGNTLKVNTSAAKGATGTWVIDPDTLTIDSSNVGTYETQLNTSNVDLTANISITLNAAFDTSSQTNSNTLNFKDGDANGHLTVDLNAPITLGANQHLIGDADVVNLVAGALIQNGIDVARTSGATVNVGAGTYAAGSGIQINKSHISLVGASGAEIDVNPGASGQVNAITIGGTTDGVTVSGFDIRGEITGSYINYAFGSAISRGIAVKSGATNFTISNNDIRNVRTGILVDGAASTSNTTPTNSGIITGNLIDNTKGGLLINYTDGTGITITGNRQGTAGNEWGEIWHLQGSHTGTASSSVQIGLLAASTANNGWTVEDQAYAQSNRTAVTVSDHETSALPAATGLTPSDSNQGSYRSPLATIQAGINAVVSGGTVNVLNGNYVISSGYINVNKSLDLIGQSESGVIIDARNASTYGLRVTATDGPVDLENFTLYGVTSGANHGGYGLKAEATNGLTLSHITSEGAYKSEFDLNGVLNGSLSYLDANGYSVGTTTSTGGNGISFTNSQNITLTHSTTENNAWGGLALYQGTTYGNLQLTGITVDGSNIFHEANGIYAQDQSTVTDIGTINLGGQGIEYVAKIDVGQLTPADYEGSYIFFQTTKQGAIDAAAGANTGYGRTNATVQGYVSSNDGIDGNNTFYVGQSTGGTNLFIQAAVDAAIAGATINVAAGTYAETLDITKSVDIEGAGVGQTIIQPTSLLDSGVGHKYTSDAKVTVLVNGASDVTLNGLTINGNDLGNDAVVLWNNSSGSITNSLIENAKTFDGTQTGQALAVDASSGNTDTLTVDNVTFQNFNKNAIDAETGEGSYANGGNITLTVENSHITGAGDTNVIAQNGIVLWEQGGGTIDATIDNVSFANLSFSDPNVATAAGVLQYGSANGTVTVKNSTFASSVQEYISSAGGSTHEINATLGNTFDGVLESVATLDQLFAIQDHIIDGLNDASNGLVRLVANNVYVTAANGDIATGVAKASSGNTVHIQDGDYTLAGELDITKSLSLVGQSAATNITSLSTGYGINVTGDNVSLQNFTYHGPTGNGSTYGIKVQPDTGLATDRLLNFDIENVTIDGGYRTGLDLNGVVNATIKNVSVSNIVHGNGIALTDSANVTITGSTTTNNAWGGLALYQTNTYYDQQVNNITVDGTNTFNETNGIYAQDQSASKDLGTLTLAGYDYMTHWDTLSSDGIYTFFQKTSQAAIDIATSVSPTTAYVEGYTGNGELGNNIFYVGYNTGNTNHLNINTAVNAATSGGTINVGSGTYAEDVAPGTQLTFNFSNVTLGSLSLGSAAAGSSLNGHLTANGAISSEGVVNLSGNFTAALISLNSTASLTGNTTLYTRTAGGNITVASVTGGGNNLTLDAGSGAISLGNVAGVDALSVNGAATLTGTTYAANSETFDAVTLTGDTALTATNVTVASVTGGGNDLAITGATSLGDVAGVGALSVDGAATLTGTTYTASSENFGAVTLTGDTALKANNVTVSSVAGGGNDLSITGATSLGNVANAGALSVSGAATLTGTSYAAASENFDAVTLTGNTKLDTSAANGNITVASVTGGGNNLTIDAGTGLTSLGNVAGAGALAVDGAARLTGSTYNAGSILFGGDVTLTASTTTLNTSAAAGDITVKGDIFGTADGGQSLTLNAGPGTGSASANGDITLQNAGTTAVNLNNLTVSGNNFTALTVDLAGNYNAVLTGNQVFASDTLNVKGNATSTVGGNASGHVVAGGGVSFTAQGDVSGTISGANVNLTGNDVNATVTASDTANVTGNTVEGTYKADTVILTASNNVNAAVNATDFTLAAANGSVGGTWTSINTDGSGVVDVNGQPTVGQANLNPNQLVVEGFTLPAGTTIGANGQLILPQGVLLGLLSPGGGKPKMILVHTVQQLGELLASGYSVIVIDLSGNDKDKPIQLASN